jgi:2-succinyl-6-hydroxy-2,4-cyclohexadiene-1-carboxylate synthase
MSLHFTTAGDDKHRALMLLHGFMGRGEDWRRVADHLSDHRSVILPDLPGHGRSRVTAPEDHSITATVNQLLALLDRLGVDRVDLAGYSLGARIALQMALTAPERVRHLVLESGSAGLRSDDERKQRQAADGTLAARLRQGDLKEFITDWYRRPLFGSLQGDPRLLDDLCRRRLDNRSEGLALSLEWAGTGVMPPLWLHLGELEMPVLLACGRLDRKFVAINEEMSSLIPRSRLQVFDDAGHNIHLERPTEFITELDRFLGSA